LGRRLLRRFIYGRRLMRRARKALKLPLDTQIRIARDFLQKKKSTPNYSMKDHAIKHNCSYEQVRSYVEKLKLGRYAFTDSSVSQARMAEIYNELHIKIDESDVDVLMQQILVIEEQLKRTDSFKPEERTKIAMELAKLKKLREDVLKAQNENEKYTLKKEFLYRFAKRLKSTITESDAIKIAREVADGL